MPPLRTRSKGKLATPTATSKATPPATTPPAQSRSSTKATATAVAAAAAAASVAGPVPKRPALEVADGEPSSKRSAAETPSPQPSPSKSKQCSKCKAAGKTDAQCSNHRADSAKHCEECGVYVDHEPSCSKFGTPTSSPSRRVVDPFATFWTSQWPIVYFFLTVVKSGRDIPGLWFQATADWLASRTHLELGEQYLLTEERGKRDHHLHDHAVFSWRVPDTTQAKNKLIKSLKQHLAVTPNDGTKIQLLTLGTAAAFLNTKRYICKDHAEPWHQFSSCTIDKNTVIELGKQYGDTQQSDYEGSKNILKPKDLLTWFQEHNKAYNLNPGLGDAVLWSVRSGDIRLSLSFVNPKGSAKFDPESSARFAAVMATPEEATPRDIYCILFGSIDPSTKKRVTKYYYNDGGCDFESVRAPLVFKPEFYGKSRGEAQAVAHIGAAGAINAGAAFRMQYSDLWYWQQKVADLFKTNESAKFGRTVHWIWEATGNVGKSVLASYFVDCCGAIEVAGTCRDSLYAICAYVEANGRGPPMILFDLARSHEDIDYETIEKGKDGKFFNSKYEGKLVRYARPHVLCFSNQPPDLTMLSADRYHVIQLGVDLAMDRIAPAVEAAPEQPAIQGGGAVQARAKSSFWLNLTTTTTTTTTTTKRDFLFSFSRLHHFLFVVLRGWVGSCQHFFRVLLNKSKNST